MSDGNALNRLRLGGGGKAGREACWSCFPLLYPAPASLMLPCPHDMRRRIEPQLAVRADVRCQHLLRLSQDARDHLLIEVDPHDRQPAAQIRLDHGTHTGKACRSRVTHDTWRADSGAVEQRHQCLLVAKHEWRPQGVRRLFTSET